MALRFLCVVMAASCIPSASAMAPDHVQQSFRDKFGDGIQPAWEVDVNGYWEASFDKNGKSIRVDFKDSGKWVETEKNLNFDELPGPVQVAVRKEFADRPISEIEEVNHWNKGHFFDVEFSGPGPNEDVEYLPDGSRVQSGFEIFASGIADFDARMTNLKAGNVPVSEMTRGELFFEFGLNLITIMIYAFGIYYLRHHDHKMMFLLFAFNLFLFPIFLLNSVLTAGFGFTIFALLALVRLRSENFDKAEIAYLLGAVSLTFINSQLTAKIEIVASLLVLITAYLADHSYLWRGAYQTTEIRYRLSDKEKMLDRTYLSRKISEDYQIRVNEIEIDRVSRKCVRLTVIYQDKTNNQLLANPRSESSAEGN